MTEKAKCANLAKMDLRLYVLLHSEGRKIHLTSFPLLKQVESGKFCLSVTFFLIITCKIIWMSQNLF